MTFQFKLPDIAEGVHEGEIVAWHVKEGQSVKEDQDMVEVMTDKATVMIKSPKTGTIGNLLAKEGQVVHVGDVIITIEVAGAASAPAAPAPAPAAAAAKPAEEEKTLFDLPSEFSGASKLRKPPTAGAPKPVAATGGAASAVSGAPAAAPQAGLPGAPVPLRAHTLAAPAIRWAAREKGIDLNTVPASSPNGRVTWTDWQAFLARGPAPDAGRAAPPPMAAASAGPGQAAMARTIVPAPAIAVGAADEIVPLKGLRKAIHDNMRRSKDHAAHFTYWDEADVTELVKLRKDAQKLAEAQGVKLSYLPFVVKAVVAALKRYPDMNAWVDEGNRSLVRKREYHVGIATATERGLTVVVVRDADKKSIFQIAKEIDALAAKAREGKASREELTGSTFTITSLGKDGGLGATPIINHPEVAILGIHKIEPRAKVNEDRDIVVRDCMNISGSYDHRWIDGHVAAAFQQVIIELLSKPNLLLLGTA